MCCASGATQVTKTPHTAARSIVTERTRLGVLGKPIAHSRSPQIHRAAYEVLGLPWEYQRYEVGAGELAAWVGALDHEWRGLSLTMPLKAEAMALADWHSPAAEATGSVNTLVFHDGSIRGHNTDVYGIVQALWQQGVSEVRRVHVLGAGATATSVLAATAQLGAKRASIAARRPEQFADLARVASAFGLHLELVDWAEAGDADLVVNTVPGGVTADVDFAPEVLRRSALFDVVYDPWPSPLAARWLDAGGSVASGLDMLFWQAVLQVRLFLGVGEDDPLPDEERVLAAMRKALG